MLRNIRIRYERGRIVDQADGSRAITAHNPIIEDMDDPQAFAGVLVQNITFSINAGDLVPHLVLEAVPTGSLTIEGPMNVQGLNRLNPNSELSHPDVVNYPVPPDPPSSAAERISSSVVEALLSATSRPEAHESALSAIADYLNTRYRECLTPEANQHVLGMVRLTLPITEDMVVRSQPTDIRQTISESMAAVFQRMLPTPQPQHTVPITGVGRIRREDYQFHFGDWVVDVDEVRTHAFPSRLLSTIETWNPPPTAAELIWLADILRGYLPGTVNEAFRQLFAIASRVSTRQHVPPAAPSPPRSLNRRSIEIDPPGRPARVPLDV